MSPLDDAQRWLYHLGDVSAARADAIAATNADLVVTEWASYARGEDPYGPALLDRMRGGDADRLIVSYLSIGEAETYRYYWRDAWERRPPAWIGEANPEWDGNIKVRYWDPAWQAIVLDYLDRIIDAGFNGVYLDIIDAFQFWRGRAPGVDVEQEMADFVALIDVHAQARIAATDPGRPFVIIGQNGVELLANATYRDAVDGVAQEDLRFVYENGSPDEFTPQSGADYRYGLELLRDAEADDIATFVVEYVPADQRDEAARLLGAEAADLRATGIPLYVAESRDLDGIGRPLANSGGPGPGEPRPVARIVGGARDDRLGGGDASELLAGRAGDDRLAGQGGRDVLFGDAGRDRLAGGKEGDVLFGGKGGDALAGGAGADRLYGGAGSDRLEGGAGRDVLDGGAGTDLFVFRAGSGRDTVHGFDDAVDRIDLPDGASVVLSDVKRGLRIDYGDGAHLLVVGESVASFDADALI